MHPGGRELSVRGPARHRQRRRRPGRRHGEPPRDRGRGVPEHVGLVPADRADIPAGVRHRRDGFARGRDVVQSMGTTAPQGEGVTAIHTARRVMTVVVVATAENEVAGLPARLGRLGVDTGRVLAPGGHRRLVLSWVEDEWEGERLTAVLRAEGMVAVSRPDGGARLDAWRRHTRPITFGPRLSVCFAWSEHD